MREEDMTDKLSKKEVRYSTTEFAELIGVCSRTLIRWDRKGLFKACRTASGNPYYTDEQYDAYVETCHKLASKPTRRKGQKI